LKDRGKRNVESQKVLIDRYTNPNVKDIDSTSLIENNCA